MSTINERLKQFVDDQDLSLSKLAKNLDIQPSSVTHIISGRNKPSVR